MYGEESVDRIFAIIKNNNCQEKRRANRAAGIPRDRNAEAQRRINISERSNRRAYLGKIASLFEITCIFCKSLSGYKKIGQEDNDVQMVRANSGDLQKYIYHGSLWMCKPCEDLKSKLKNGEPVIEALIHIHKRTLEEMKQVVGLLEIETEEDSRAVLYPIIDANIPYALPDPSKPEADLTAMVFDRISEHQHFNEEPVSKERVACFSNVAFHDPGTLLDTLYRDTYKRMKVSKEMSKEKLKNLPMGFVVDDILHLAAQQDQEDNDYFLREYRGTTEYRKRLATETKWREAENGSQVVTVNKLIFAGLGQDHSLAKVMLSLEGIPVQKDTVNGELALIVPCHLGGIPTCNIKTCEARHKSALEAAYELYPDGHIPEEKIFPVAHYLKRSTDIFIQHQIKKYSTEHDLWLEFTRSGKVFLRGNLWVDSVQDTTIDEAARRLTLTSHPLFQSQEYTLSNHVVYLEETEPAFCEELFEITGVMRSDLRETSFMEAIFCMAKGLQIRWASQDVVKLDVRDEEMVIHLNIKVYASMFIFILGFETV